MDREFTVGEQLPELVGAVVASYDTVETTRHIDAGYLPSRGETEELIERLLELAYPGFFGRQDLTRHNVAYHVGELLPRIGELAYRQVLKSLCFEAERCAHVDRDYRSCEEQARDVTVAFLRRIPEVRRHLAGDVRAAFDGDPAAQHTDEVILAYPGLMAVSVFRFAHELCELGVPLMPRIMTEWSHARTGVDIHPGATIGSNFFIDHGTGVVIGETTEIGDHVKLYQGVTLGALSIPRDEGGRVIRGAKRHPTVGDHVTLYANAIVLGGDTVIGEHSVIGGSVFLTSSVPPYSTVTFDPPKLSVRARGAAREAAADVKSSYLPDYSI